MIEHREDRPPERAAEVRAAVTAVRDDLLSEHLGTTPGVLEREVARTGSLIGAIESLRQPGGMGRTLEVLDTPDPGALAASMTDARLFDPERPVPARGAYGAGEAGVHVVETITLNDTMIRHFCAIGRWW